MQYNSLILLSFAAIIASTVYLADYTYNRTEINYERR